ncbi:MAG: hypothetical protein VW520_09395, partial [Candidatus Puniceispirillum sp.]
PPKHKKGGARQTPAPVPPTQSRWPTPAASQRQLISGNAVKSSSDTPVTVPSSKSSTAQLVMLYPRIRGAAITCAIMWGSNRDKTGMAAGGLLSIKALIRRK